MPYFKKSMDEETRHQRVEGAKHLSRKLEGRLSPYLCGERITLADFWAFAAYSSVIINPHMEDKKLKEEMANMLSELPKVSAWIALMSEPLKEYIDSRPVSKI